MQTSVAAKQNISKSKARKQEQKNQTAKEQQAKSLVEELKQDKDILASYPTFATYQRNGCNLSIQYQHATDLSSETLAWAYHLCEQNMRAMYEDVWGWKPAQKHRELKDPNARFLLVVDKSDDVDKPVAYLHLRFEVEEHVPILYVYEVQLEQRIQQKGLGAFLMTFLKLYSKKNQLERIVLTVMDANATALKMYTKLGYKPDPSCPSQADPVGHLEDPTGYSILSLRLI